MTANISKEVEFVRHGIEEAAGELISRLKPRKEPRISSSCAAKISYMTEKYFFAAQDVSRNSIKVNKTKFKMQKREVIVSMIQNIPDFRQMISQLLLM